MDLSERLSKKCTLFIETNLEKSDIELEQIEYGLHVIFLNTFKIIILFVTAYFLGVLKYTFIAFLGFASVRRFAGGIHCDSSLNCTIVNYIVFLGNTYLSLYLPLNKLIQSICFLISLILFIMYAPADTANKPLVSKKLRKKSKSNSIIAACLVYCLTLFISSNLYASLIIYSVLIESILITPLIYKISKKEYKNYEKVKF